MRKFDFWFKQMHIKNKIPTYNLKLPQKLLQEKKSQNATTEKKHNKEIATNNKTELINNKSNEKIIVQNKMSDNEIVNNKTSDNQIFKSQNKIITNNEKSNEKINKDKNKIQEIPFTESKNLSELRINMSKVDFEFKKYASTMVFSDGNPDSNLMLIGEAPGQEEDKQGKPFVGESGQLLESILNAADIYRKNYYITNIVPWRPPNNRTPSTEEIKIMRPYILNHIEIINPKIVVLIGSTAYKSVMNQTKAITTVRGEFIEKNERLYIPIFHPSYLLRSPSKKKEMWHDILTIKHKLNDLQT